MTLPEIDLEHLGDTGGPYEVVSEANMTCVVLKDFPLPVGYDHDRTDLLIRLNPGYPDVPPDMWWLAPGIRLADGRTVQATESIEQHLGRSWQRWSRHLNAGQWRSGIDGLKNYLALIRKELERCTGRTAT